MLASYQDGFSKSILIYHTNLDKSDIEETVARTCFVGPRISASNSRVIIGWLEHMMGKRSERIQAA